MQPISDYPHLEEPVCTPGTTKKIMAAVSSLTLGVVIRAANKIFVIAVNSSAVHVRCCLESTAKEIHTLEWIQWQLQFQIFYTTCACGLEEWYRKN
jgi:hypothetical protein